MKFYVGESHRRTKETDQEHTILVPLYHLELLSFLSQIDLPITYLDHITLWCSITDKIL